MLTYNNILNDYLMTFRYFGGYYSWQKSKLTRVSNLVSTAGFIVDGYNGIKFDAKIKSSLFIFRPKHCRHTFRFRSINEISLQIP